MKQVPVRKQLTFLALLGITLIISGLVAQPVFGKTKLRLQSVFPPSSSAYKEIALFAKTVKQRTNGEIDIKVYAPGALAKTLEVFESVKRGVIDMGFSAGLYHARKVPEGLVEFTLPYTFAGPIYSYEAAAQYYEYFYDWRGGIVQKEFEKVYNKHNIHLLGTGSGSSYGFMTRKPVKTLADFKGKKLRTFGLYSVLAKKFGAAPVSIPSSEQYLGLQRGTIDGTIYPYYALETFKLHEVLTHIIFPPPTPTPIIDCYVNMRKWRRLTKDQQQIIDAALKEHMIAYTKKALAIEKSAVQDAQKRGLKLVHLPQKDVDRLKEISKGLWPIAAKKSAKSAELLGLMKEYLTEKGLY